MLTSVEQTKQPEVPSIEAHPPLVYWAEEIKVLESEGVLNVIGTKRVPPPAGASDRDLVTGYLDALANVNAKAGNESTMPHIVFANCGAEPAALKKFSRDHSWTPS